MSKIFLISRYELTKAFSRRSYLFVAFGIPLIAVAIVAVVSLWRGGQTGDALPGGDEAVEVAMEGFVDLSGLITTIPADLPEDALQAFPTQAAAAQALESGEIRGYYIIPEDYLSRGMVTFVSTNALIFEVQSQEWMMRWALLVGMLGGDAEFASMVFNPVKLEVERRGVESGPDRYSEEDCSRPGPACRSSVLVEMLPMMMVVMFFMFITLNSGMLLRNIGGEKQNRTMEILMLSISPRQMFTGKMLGLGIAGFLQSTAWIVALWAMLRIGGGAISLPAEFHLPATLIIVWLVYFILGYALYASLMSGVGALVPDIKAGSQASTVVMLPLILGYMLTVMPFTVEDSNGVLPVILSLFPLTSPVSMIMRMAVGGVPMWQLALSVGLLAVSVVLVLRAVGKVFRTQMILSGQPLTIRRYLRALLM